MHHFGAKSSRSNCTDTAVLSSATTITHMVQHHWAPRQPTILRNRGQGAGAPCTLAPTSVVAAVPPPKSPLLMGSSVSLLPASTSAPLLAAASSSWLRRRCRRWRFAACPPAAPGAACAAACSAHAAVWAARLPLAAAFLSPESLVLQHADNGCSKLPRAGVGHALHKVSAITACVAACLCLVGSQVALEAVRVL